MKKEELRKGNLIHHIGLGTSMILEIRNDGISLCYPKNKNDAYFESNDNLHRLDYLPIDNEILLKFSSFTLEEIFNCKIYISKYQFHVSELDGKYKLIFKENTKSPWIPLIELEFVNQLQNVMFELTKEELKLKP